MTMSKVMNKMRRLVVKPFRWSNPRMWADALYRDHFGRSIDWQNPQEFNEKLRYLQFETDTKMWTQLADKYLARDYVSSKGKGDMLVQLYGAWDNVEEINFETLPNSFVMKTNHGCGMVELVPDKNAVNLEALRKRMRSYLRQSYGYKLAEIHYLPIKRRVMVEQLLVNDSSYSSVLVDYKFYCFYGEPFCCIVFTERDIRLNRKLAQVYDMNWTPRPEWARKEALSPQKTIMPPPQSLQQMVEACRVLAADFPFVRMDFYESQGHPYFGEFTFTPAACGGGVLTKDFCKQVLGSKLMINQIL